MLVHSTLNAQNIVVGTNGFLGGTGTITGNVVNYGKFSPGNSPGALVIGESFSTAAGSRTILEVESNGHGGFNTGHAIFTSGNAIDLSHLNAQFRCLGATDPNAFQTHNLFATDTFFKVKQSDGSLTVLDPALFSGAVFSAQADSYTITNFTFNATTRASQLRQCPSPRREP